MINASNPAEVLDTLTIDDAIIVTIASVPGR